MNKTFLSPLVLTSLKEFAIITKNTGVVRRKTMNKKLIAIPIALFCASCVVVTEPEPDPVVIADERFVCYYDCGFEEVCCYPAYFREGAEGVCYPLTYRETEDYCY